MVGFLSALSTGASVLNGIGSLTSAFGGGSSSARASRLAKEAEDRQLQNSLLYAEKYPARVVKGAEIAGIHPLAALGINPSLSGGSHVSTGAEVSNQMGQNISRAAKALQSVGDRAHMRKMEDLALERAQLENDLLRGQITNVHKATTPAIGTGRNDGQGNGVVEVTPDRQISKRKGDKGLTAGQHAAMRKYDLGNGQTMELPFNEEGPSEAIQSLPWPVSLIKWGELAYKRNWKKTPSGLAEKISKSIKAKQKKRRQKLRSKQGGKLKWWQY
jgi:hypothetical protein